MPFSVSEVGDPRTYLEAVQKVMGGCGLNRPADLTSPDRNTVRAMEAVTAALQEIWYEAKWDFRFKWHVLEMVAGQMWYDLPEDWDKSGMQAGLHKQVNPITYKNYEWLQEHLPHIRNIPAEFSDGTLTSEADDPNHDYAGATTYWTIKGGYLGLVLAPSADFLTSHSDRLVLGCYRHLVDPVDGSDDIGLSRELYPAHHYIALGQFKQMLEWSDFAITESRGRGVLAKQVARHQQLYYGENQLMPGE